MAVAEVGDGRAQRDLRRLLVEAADAVVLARLQVGAGLGVDGAGRVGEGPLRVRLVARPDGRPP